MSEQMQMIFKEKGVSDKEVTRRMEYRKQTEAAEEREQLAKVRKKEIKRLESQITECDRYLLNTKNDRTMVSYYQAAKKTAKERLDELKEAERWKKD